MGNIVMKNKLKNSFRGLAICAASAFFLTACGSDAQQSGTVQTKLLANGEACSPAWVSTTAYIGGNKVSYNGVNYTANWWTQGNNPATSNGGVGTGQPWTAGFTCGGATTTTTKAATTTTIAATTTTTIGQGAVCFYQDINFQGASFCVNEGAADTPAGWNDAASSVKVASGYNVSLFADAGQQGASIALSADEPSLVARSFNDLMSSFKVAKAGSTTTTTKATTTTTAASCNYITWTTGQNYAVGTVVKYAPNGNYYRLVNAGTNGSDGTDPTISTWYWSQTTCGGTTTTVTNTTTTTTAGELRVLTYLKNLSGHGIIGGLIRDHKDGSVENQVIADAGVPLGFYGGDFGFGDSASTANRAALMQKLITQYRQGVVVQLMWHACSPAKAVTNQQETGCYWGDSTHLDGGVLPSKLDNGQWTDLVTDGGYLNKVWKGRLDLIAPHFQTLKDAGVQVLFRPFHEVNQGAFWWGGRTGSQGTARLFELTRDYLEQKYNLHNIIWVWDVQDLSAPSTYADYLPRAQYFDIAALDMYSEGFTQAHYDAMLALAKGKPIAIGEAFKVPSPATLAAQPKWVFFMGWSDPEFLTSNSYDQIRTFYRSAVPPKPGF